MKRGRVAVLGAGLQGVCAALALRRQGLDVVLVDQAPDCMLRASLRNEGKIHLGFVYAKDPSFRTPLLMLESSLRFADLIETYVGGTVDWEAIRSRPFVYVVARESMVATGDLLDFYGRLQDAYFEIRDGRGYLGRTPDRLWREIPARDMRKAIAPGFAETFVETAEVALDLVGFRNRVRSALHAFTGIKTRYGHRVRSVARTSAGFRIEGERTDGSTWTQEAGIVVNCLWDGRLEIDDTLGLVPNGRNWVHRFKYRLLGDVPEDLKQLPSLTLVVGPYGDMVIHPTGRIYVSWYPACMRGWSDSLSIPEPWHGPSEGRVGEAQTKSIVDEALAGFGRIVPGLEACEIDVVDGGVICAWGESDIDDPGSELHTRYDTGVRSHDGYFSIDTGKLTCAPLYANHLLDAIG